MFIERMLSNGSAPLLERVVEFSARRHNLILENIANVDTPDYRQRDLSVERFQAMLRERIEQRRRYGPDDVGFDGLGGDVMNPTRNILFHDNNNRSMEQLATDLAKNAMMHNLAIELLRKQYMGLETALRERIA